MSLDDVLEKFEEHMEPAYNTVNVIQFHSSRLRIKLMLHFHQMVKELQNRDKWRNLLRTPLDADNRRCYYENCREQPSTMPELKNHLRWHFDRMLEARKKVQKLEENMERLRKQKEAAMQNII